MTRYPGTGIPLAALCLLLAGSGESQTGQTPRVHHSAIGATVHVTSTHRGQASEGPPEALVDGDLRTRWSSDYAQPQEVVVVFPNPIRVNRLRLHWESALASRYTVAFSSDGREWTLIATRNDDTAGPRTDTVSMKNLRARAVRLEFVNRINKTWGFSLYEIEVIETQDWTRSLAEAGIVVKSLRADKNGMYSVDLSGTDITDISPLAGMPLTYLALNDTQVSDLSPLRGSSLTMLSLIRTPVRDLSPLEGLPLVYLVLSDTPVSDLRPLAGAPIEMLWIDGTAVTDVSPLERAPLAYLHLSPEQVTRGLAVIRRIRSLTQIGWGKARGKRLPAYLFWKKHDAGQFRRQGP